MEFEIIPDEPRSLHDRPTRNGAATQLPNNNARAFMPASTGEQARPVRSVPGIPAEEITYIIQFVEAPHLLKQPLAARPANDRLAIGGKLAFEISVRHRVFGLSLR